MALVLSVLDASLTSLQIVLHIGLQTATNIYGAVSITLYGRPLRKNPTIRYDTKEEFNVNSKAE